MNERTSTDCGDKDLIVQRIIEVEDAEKRLAAAKSTSDQLWLQLADAVKVKPLAGHLSIMATAKVRVAELEVLEHRVMDAQQAAIKAARP